MLEFLTDTNLDKSSLPLYNDLFRVVVLEQEQHAV